MAEKVRYDENKEVYSMELHERISVIRKAMGMTQEQLGKKIGVSGDVIAAWESGQTVPDALAIGVLCRELNLSADYVLLGKEPEEIRQEPAAEVPQAACDATDPAYQMPDVCPCCGRTVSGTLCPICGYPLPVHPYRGTRYAVVASHYATGSERSRAEKLVKYCGFTEEDADAAIKYLRGYEAKVLLKRDLPDSAAHWITKYLNRVDSQLKIVEDFGEPEEELLKKERAMELPPAEKSGGLGFWGVVGAVVVALLILSIF